jgi:nucleoside-diphosphate-sugar epimerase
VVKATTLAISYRPNAILNVGSGRGYSTLEIAKKLIQLSGAELEPNTNPIERRNVDIICDISAAREHLSFEPQTCLEEGIKQEIDWYWNDALTPAQKQNVNLHLETDHHNYKRRLLQRNIERTGHD